MGQTPLLGSPFHLGYVSSDLDQAMARLLDLGVGEFLVMPDDPAAPESPRIAVAYSESMMYEVIQPRARDDFFATWLSNVDDTVLCFHHVGMLAASADEVRSLRARHLTAGRDVAMEMRIPDVVEVLYVDTARLLGHYVKYVHPEAGVTTAFKAVPGSTFTHKEPT
jgi:hypothetical protein